MAAFDDDALVDAFIAAARDAYATDRVSVRNRHIAKRTKFWKQLDERGEAVRPRLLLYLSSPDPSERFGACVYTYTFAPEESFRVWEELIRNDYGEVSNWAFIQLDLMRRDGRAPGDPAELRTWQAPVLTVRAAQWQFPATEQQRQEAQASEIGALLHDGLAPEESTPGPASLRRISRADDWRNDAVSWSLVRRERGTFLLLDLDASDGSTDAECIMLEFRDCQHVKVGEYDLWQRDLIEAQSDEIYDGTGWIGEFFGSEWARDVQRTDLRHFVVPFNADAFQCLARNCFETRTIRPMKDALIEIAQELKRRDELNYPDWVVWERSRSTTTR